MSGSPDKVSRLCAVLSGLVFAAYSQYPDGAALRKQVFISVQLRKYKKQQKLLLLFFFAKYANAYQCTYFFILDFYGY